MEGCRSIVCRVGGGVKERWVKVHGGMQESPADPAAPVMTVAADGDDRVTALSCVFRPESLASVQGLKQPISDQ